MNLCLNLQVTIAGCAMGVFQQNHLVERYRVLLAQSDEWYLATKTGQGPLKVEMPTGEILTPDMLPQPIEEEEFIDSPIAVLPPQGDYGFHGRFSKASILWLESVSRNTGHPIRHAMSPEGEYRLPGSNYRVDGWDSENRICYEVDHFDSLLNVLSMSH